MNNLQIKALLAGMFFGLWPLCMNRSGLSGNNSSMVFSAFVLLFVIPFAANSEGDNAQAKWLFIISAGFLAAIGVIFFNGMLAKATEQEVGALVVVMVISETAVPAIYHVIQNGGLSMSRGFGFAFAFIAAVLLARE